MYWIHKRFSLLFILGIISMLLISCSGHKTVERKSGKSIPGIRNVGIVYDWDEITEETQDSLLTAVRKYVDLVGKGKVEESYGITHERFRDTINKYEYKSFFKALEFALPDYDSLRFIKGKKIVFEEKPDIDQIIVGGSFDGTNPDHMKLQALKGIKSQATLIFDNQAMPVSRFFIAVLGIDNGEYKLYHLGVNPSALNGNNIDYYSAYADRWNEKGQLLTSAIARLCALKMSSYAGAVQDNNTAYQMASFEKIMSNKPGLETENWIIAGKKIVFVDFDVLELKNDIVVEIKYVTNQEPGEEEITKEAEKLMILLDKIYPELKQVFPKILFNAFKEYPALQIQYESFRVPLYFKDVLTK